MTKTDGDPRVVVVAGDLMTDWNLVRLPGSRSAELPGGLRAIRTESGPGGAAQLGLLISALSAGLQKENGSQVEVRMLGTSADDGHRSFALWHEFTNPDGKRIWRIAEMLGIDVRSDPTQPPVDRSDDTGGADLVVLKDAGLGFRNSPRSWPRAITRRDAAPWIVLEMAGPVATGGLWDALESRSERVIAIVRADDLRLTDAHISRELSWERTAQDLLWELTYGRRANRLSRCAHLIVSFDTAGALLLSRSISAAQARLFFDPVVMENEWIEQRPGSMVGYTSCLTASVVRQALLDPQHPDLATAIQRGTAAMRTLHEDGYEPTITESGIRLTFPLDPLIEKLSAEERPLAEATVPGVALETEAEEVDRSDRRPWTILEEAYPDGLEPVARTIALVGPDEIVRNVPIGRFGKLLTIDRQEIEGLRSIRSLIWQYSRRVRPDRPLSIAVFGRPGSGKSFGIKQVAVSMLPELIETVTFNLSQFHEPSQILDALHQVRDASLKGKLPLVFWDEFDTSLANEELGWLRHFLAPMQDGEFQDGQVTHHIGPAIFVFAGGTKHTMEAFRSQESPQFVARKGPDFVSRLKGYVNILGPDPLGNDSDGDPYHVIRRAILLRTMLSSYPALFRERELQIDQGILRAFLRVPTYRHGARSLESLISMSLLDGRTRFERSSLPSEHQLALHVDPVAFMDLVRSLTIEGDLLEEMAEAIHTEFCSGEIAAGRANESLVAFEELPDDLKEQNRDFARDIPNKLAAIGYEARQARAGEDTSRLPEEVVELLAEEEHDRWMRLKLRSGWSHGSENDPIRLLHPALVPWRELGERERAAKYGSRHAAGVGNGSLPEEEKDKDRRLVSAITAVLAKHGYYIGRTKETNELASR